MRPEARAAIARFSEADEANPAAVHRGGQRARRALEEARERVARLIGAAAREIVFTSGGTESNNLAIRGVADAQSTRRKIVSSAIEHSSILAPLEFLARPRLRVIRVAPDREGRIAPAAVAAALDADTALVTLGLANAEVGTIQDVAAMAEPIARAGRCFMSTPRRPPAAFPMRVDDLRCDLLTH